MTPTAIDHLGVDFALKVAVAWFVIAFIAGPFIGRLLHRNEQRHHIDTQSDYWDYIAERREADQRARERAQAMARRKAS